MQTQPQPLARPLYVDLLILVFIATVARLIGVGIDHFPVDDELYHVLAAQSWAAEGTLRIADGVYERAALFTMFVGTLFVFFGDSVVIARLPVLIFGILWVLLLFVWVNNHAGRLAAWIAAILFALAPLAIELSLYSRMYTPHGFLFLLGSIMAFSIATHDYSVVKKILLLSCIVACFSLALHLHDITLIGLVALVVALVVDFFIQRRQIFTNKKHLFWLMSLLFFFIAIGVILLYQYWELLIPSWQRFVTPAYAQLGFDVRHYHKLFTASYPVLWLLLPLAVIIAIYSRPRFGLFCAIVFIIIFLIHSIAGRKEERYIYYGVPFLFAIWGVTLAVIVPHLNRLLTDISGSLRTNYLLLGKISNFDLIFKRTVTFVAIIFFLSGSGAFLRTINIWQGESYFFGVQRSNWEKAVPKLKPLVDDAPVVVTTNFLKTLYYFGHFDIAFSPVAVADVLKGNEGGLDPRTGRPVIGTVESLQQLFVDHPSGIFVGQKTDFRNRLRVTNEAADFLEKHARQVELPEESRIFAFTWKNAG